MSHTIAKLVSAGLLMAASQAFAQGAGGDDMAKDAMGKDAMTNGRMEADAMKK